MFHKDSDEIRTAKENLALWKRDAKIAVPQDLQFHRGLFDTQQLLIRGVYDASQAYASLAAISYEESRRYPQLREVLRARSLATILAHERVMNREHPLSKDLKRALYDLERECARIHGEFRWPAPWRPVLQEEDVIALQNAAAYVSANTFVNPVDPESWAVLRHGDRYSFTSN